MWWEQRDRVETLCSPFVVVRFVLFSCSWPIYECRSARRREAESCSASVECSPNRPELVVLRNGAQKLDGECITQLRKVVREAIGLLIGRHVSVLVVCVL